MTDGTSMLSAASMVYRYKIILYLYTGLDPAPTERGGVTHISKDNEREIGYYLAHCIVFLPK